MITQTLHFTITGEYMTNFSRELWVEGRINFAVNEFLCGSLPGLSEKQAIDVVTGKKKFIGENNLDLVEDDSGVTEVYGIDLSLEAAWKRLCKNYVDQFGDIATLQRRIGILYRQQSPYGSSYRMSKNDDYNIDWDRDKFKKYNEKLKETMNSLSLVGKYCNKSFKDLPNTFNIYPSGVNERLDVGLNPIDIDDILAMEPKSDTPSVPDREEVEEYIKNVMKIHDKLKEPIKPNPISDVNDAGWIAPNGDWYGLNGMISNFLHITIADKLEEDSVIEVPEGEKSDTFLRKEGWITIQRGWILYDGYFHGKEITPEQQHAMYIYGQHYSVKSNKMPRLGISQKPVSGVRIKSLDKCALKKLFEI